MKLRNIKAHFTVDREVDVPDMRRILKGNDATFTVHRHHRDVIHVTGVKSRCHLQSCVMFLEQKLTVKIRETIIDNPFYSHKDDRNINMSKIYGVVKELEEYKVVFEPELFAGMTIRNISKGYPTIILFRTGSFQLLGGQMENVKQSPNFIINLIAYFTITEKDA